MSSGSKRSPDGRYSKSDTILGSGVTKVVYIGYDLIDGKQVAWNEIKLVLDINLDKLSQEIEVLKTVKHQNIISYYYSWFDSNGQYLVIITELMSGGSLTKFIHQAGHFALKAIKLWCRQILNGLKYLHENDPPIIHRDMKCDNIFINATGEVKIGDLGLCSIIGKNKNKSFVGTPNWIAPEIFNGDYDEKVDIWGFGMCCIELFTHHIPYDIECSTEPQIYKRVMEGTLPLAIDLIKDDDTKEFIKLCLKEKNFRPGASALLNHPFLQETPENDRYVNLISINELKNEMEFYGRVIPLKLLELTKNVTDNNTIQLFGINYWNIENQNNNANNVGERFDPFQNSTTLKKETERNITDQKFLSLFNDSFTQDNVSDQKRNSNGSNIFEDIISNEANRNNIIFSQNNDMSPIPSIEISSPPYISKNGINLNNSANIPTMDSSKLFQDEVNIFNLIKSTPLNNYDIFSDKIHSNPFLGNGKENSSNNNIKDINPWKDDDKKNKGIFDEYDIVPLDEYLDEHCSKSDESAEDTKLSFV